VPGQFQMVQSVKYGQNVKGLKHKNQGYYETIEEKQKNVITRF